MSPDSEPRIPFACFRDVRGNDGKVFPPGSADHVDLSAALARSQYQAAMAARASAWPDWQAEAPAPLCWRRTCRRLGLALSPSSPARGRVGHARPLRSDFYLRRGPDFTTSSGQPSAMSLKFSMKRAARAWYLRS